MNKFCKGLVTVALATTICFSGGISAFAVETNTEAEVKTTVNSQSHTATLYEPETREKLEFNKWEKFLGNVVDNAYPSVVTAGKITMMSLTDLKEVIEEKGTTEEGFSTTVTTTINSSLYSVFNEKTQTWSHPKYIPASANEWYSEGSMLYTDGKDIYAASLEFKKDEQDGSDFMGDVFAGEFPESQIVVYKYNPESSSFSIFKIIESKEGYTKSAPQLIFEDDAIVVAWIEMKNKGVFEMMGSGMELAVGFTRFKDNKWSEQTSFAETQKMVNDIESEPYTFSTIDGKFAVAYCDKYGEKEKIHILIKNEFGTLILGREGAPEIILNATPSKSDGFYYFENGNLYYVNREVVDGQKKLVHDKVAENIPDASEIDVSENDELFYRTKKDSSSLYVRTFDANKGKFVEDKMLREKSTEIQNVSVANYKDNTMIVILTDERETQSLSELDAEYCGFDVSYMLFNKAKSGAPNVPSTDSNTSTEPSTNNTDKNPTEKPSDVPTTSLNPDDSDKKPESTTRGDKDYNDSYKDSNVDIPDTGISKVVGVAVAALVVSGLCILILKKKKD